MNRQIIASVLLAGCLVPQVWNAQPAAPVRARVVIDPGPDGDQVNPTGRTVVLTAPLLDGETYIGDTTLTLEPGGQASFAAERLLALLEPLAPYCRAGSAEDGKRLATGADGAVMRCVAARLDDALLGLLHLLRGDRRSSQFNGRHLGPHVEAECLEGE